MDEQNTAVNTGGGSDAGSVEQNTEAPSASAQKDTDNTQAKADQTSEKTSNTEEQSPEGESEGSNVKEGGDSKTPKTVPYDRFVESRNELREAREKAQLLEKLQQDPELASAFLKNAQAQSEPVDPAVKQATEILKSQGFVTKEDLAALQQQQAQQQMQEKIVQDAEAQLAELKQKYNGENGFPPVDEEALMESLDKRGVIYKDDGQTIDLEATYFLVNQEAIIDAQAKKKRSTPHTEIGGSQGEGKSQVQADLEAAKKTGDYKSLFSKYIKRPYKK